MQAMARQIWSCRSRDDSNIRQPSRLLFSGLFLAWFRLQADGLFLRPCLCRFSKLRHATYTTRYSSLLGLCYPSSQRTRLMGSDLRREDFFHGQVTATARDGISLSPTVCPDRIGYAVK